MRLFKILTAIEEGIKFIKDEKNISFHASQQLERYAASANLNKDIFAHDISIENGKALIGGEHVSKLNDPIKLGDTSVLTKIYKIDEIPRAFAFRILEDIRDLPSSKIGSIERNGVKFKEKIETKLPKQLYEKLNTPGKMISENDVINNNIFNQIIESMKKKEKLRPITGTAMTVFGLSTALVVATLNKRMRDSRGCFVYYKGKNCKLVSCSCNGKGEFNSQCGTSCVTCSEDILNLLPASMTQNAKACIDVDGPCINCPVEGFQSQQSTKLDDTNADFETLSEIDHMYIRCINPSIWDTIVDVFGDLGNDLIEIVDSASTTTSFFLRNLKYILLVASSIIGILAIFKIYFTYLKPKKSPIIE